MPLAAITREQFAAKTWRHASSYAFAAQYNILPVTVAELTKLVPVMPLGFVKAEGGFQLVAITSLQPGINCFVAPDGSWIGDYIPAAIRAYPFQLVKPQDRDEPVLCFDMDSGLLGEAGLGEAFFEGDGPSPAIKDALTLLSDMERSRAQARPTIEALEAAELIQPWALKLQQGEQTVAVEGLFRIDETALNTLPDEAYLTLRKPGALPLVYGQLFSMNQLGMLSKAAEMGARIAAQAKAEIASALHSSQRRSDGVGDLGFKLSEGGTFKFS